MEEKNAGCILTQREPDEFFQDPSDFDDHKDQLLSIRNRLSTHKKLFASNAMNLL
jgi:hypothetical protein